MIIDKLERMEESKKLKSLANNIKNIKDLSRIITNFVKEAEKEVILFI